MKSDKIDNFPSRFSSSSAQPNHRTSPVVSKKVLGTSANNPVGHDDHNYAMPLTINLRSDIFQDQNCHPNKENIIASSQQQYSSSHDSTPISEQVAKKAVMAFHEHTYCNLTNDKVSLRAIKASRRKQEEKDRSSVKAIQVSRREQEEEDRKMARMLQDVFDCDTPRLRPRKSTRTPCV